MAKHPRNIFASRALFLCVSGPALLVAILGFFLWGQEAVAFESFSSFTFGSVPGGEPRFNFNGFNPGAARGQQGRGAVDNEGYYKVGVILRASCVVGMYLEITGVGYSSMVLSSTYECTAATRADDAGGATVLDGTHCSSFYREPSN